MKITAARVIVCCPGRNFVTLKIETDAGLTGLGDATLNGRELAVASYLTEHVVPCLIGRDAHQIEDLWQFLYKGAYWRRGPVTMSAIAAVDTRRTPETARRLKSFWAEVGLERLREGSDGSFAYNVFAVSEDQLRRLTELHDGYYQALRALIAEETPVECVALVNLQLVRLDRPHRSRDPRSVTEIP